MASMSEPKPQNVLINYDEPPRRTAPLLVVGPLAWIRKNLFSSVFDTVLTLVFATLVVWSITSLVRWSIVEANWFVITRNLRLLMLGSFEPQFQWRVEIAVLITVFVLGFSIAAWLRINRYLMVFLAIIAALFIILPPVIYALTPLPASYLAVGNTPVASGTVTETPLPALAFIGRGGENISIQVASTLSSEDTTLTLAAGFSDRATAAVVNNARNRLATDALIVQLEAQLANPAVLTEAQQLRLQDELTTAQGQVVPPIIDTYGVNQQTVTLQILRGDTLEVFAETVLASGDAAWVVQLPQDGWYVLNKTTVEGAEGVTLLETRGIDPIIERTISIPIAGGGSTSASQYLRISDELLVDAEVPEIDAVPVPFMVIIDHQYKGIRPLSDWLRLHIALFLQWSGRLLLPLLAVAAVGYVIARAISRQPINASAQSWSSTFPTSIARGFALSANKASFIAARLWIILPFVVWMLIAGIGGALPFTDVERWGGLLLTLILAAVGIVASFPLGVLLALGRRSSLPAIKWVCTAYIEVVRGVPLITVLFMAQLLVPLIDPSLAEIKGVYRAMVGITLFSAAYLAENIRGGLQAIPSGQEEAAKAVGLNTFQMLWFITLPQALRLVIPAIVGQFISLLKDTSLVTIVGLIDLTGTARNIVGQTEFNGFQTETFAFLAVLYFTFCYTMGAISRRIEASGSGAARRI
jgi:His/Glu/Gln/Arg/opine family amino acid ABC transporter permease subunit